MATNTITRYPTPTNVTIAAPKLSTEDAKAITQAAETLKVIDRKFEELMNLNDLANAAAERFFLHDAPLPESLVAGLLDHTGAKTAANQLRRIGNEIIRELVISVTPIIQKGRAVAATDLAARCAKLEKAERTAAEAAGIHPDEYFPSPALAGLREQHRRAHELISQPADRGEITRLAAMIE